MYLLDTNVCINFALGVSERLKARMKVSLPAGLAISTISYAELSVASRNSIDPEKNRRQLSLFVGVIAIRPFDRSAAEVYGRLAREIGVRRTSFDRLIAAHALALNVTLVTNNEREFADVPDLKIENWTA